MDTTQELVAEIQRQEPTAQPIKTLRGVSGGTYACEEIALAYAMWISPKFHLIVLRAFLAMHKAQQQPQQLALPEPNPEICLDKKQTDTIKSYIEFSQEFAVDVDRTLCRFLSSLGIDITLATPDCNYGRVITNANKISTFAQRLTHQLDQAISQIYFNLLMNLSKTFAWN